MHFTTILLLTALPLTLSLPLKVCCLLPEISCSLLVFTRLTMQQPRDNPTPSSSATPATTSLTANQIQTLACICEAVIARGLNQFPAASTITALCAAYPDAKCTATPSSSSTSGTYIPVNGGLTSVLGDIGDLGGILSGLPVPVKEKRDFVEQQQVTESSTGGGLNLENTNLPALALGAVVRDIDATTKGEDEALIPGLDIALGADNLLARGENVAHGEKEKRQGLSGVTGALGGITGGLGGSNPVDVVTGLVGSLTGGLTGALTGGGSNPLSGVTGGLGGLLVREASGENQKRQGLSSVTGALSGITGGSNPVTSVVTGLVGSLTGGLAGGSNPLSSVAGGLTGSSNPLDGVTGDLPIVGNGGLSGFPGLTA